MDSNLTDIDIERACKVLACGGVILYPTDTVWGIGCDATNQAAVARVYEIKRRADSKALIVLVGSEEAARVCMVNPDPQALALMTASGRPTTVIAPRVKGLAPNLLAEDGSAALRITSEPFSRSLCLRFGRPLVSTSANISGAPGATVFSSITPELLEAVDYVCTSRRDESSVPPPSRLIKLTPSGEIITLRP